MEDSSWVFQNLMQTVNYVSYIVQFGTTAPFFKVHKNNISGYEFPENIPEFVSALTTIKNEIRTLSKERHKLQKNKFRMGLFRII